MNDNEIIEIKYLNKEIPKLKQTEGSDWIDCYNADPDIKLKSGDHKLIPLGFACKLPKGYEAHLEARSSTFKKYGLLITNSVGIIDESYCGDGDEWMLSVLATRDVEIEGYNRICQFRIIKKQPTITFKEVDTLNSPNRGGFGSTGDK